jgi:hypothetical protein
LLKFSPYEIIGEYLTYLNIPIAKKYYLQRIISHPNYPSLLSVVDTLEHLGIEHIAARIEEKQLFGFPFPYMLQFDKRRGQLALIKNQKDLDTRKADMMYWNGVIIKITPTQAMISLKENEIGDLPRTFHGYCLGAEKTGTTTIHHMFKRSFRSAHEPFYPQTIQLVLDFLENRLSKTKAAEILKERDETLNLEVESNHLLIYFSGILVDLFPEAKFMITIREPYNLLNSMLNWYLIHNFNDTWNLYRDYFFEHNHDDFEPEEEILKKKNLYPLDAFLRKIADHYNHVAANIPKHRRVMIRTDRLNNSREILSSFFNIDKLSLEIAYANANSRKRKILDQLDENFVRRKIWKYCKQIITEHFPETLKRYEF